MKFGLRLRREALPQWAQHYLHYNELKKLISLASFAKCNVAGNKCVVAAKVDEKLRSDFFVERWKDLKCLFDGESVKAIEDVYVTSGVSVTSGSSGINKDSETAIVQGNSTTTSDFPENVPSALLCKYFFLLLSKELNSIVEFCRIESDKVKKMILQYDKLRRQCAPAHGGDPCPIGNRYTLGSIWKECEQLKASIELGMVRLAAFIELNYTAFYKIVKKFDKKVNKQSLNTFMKKVDESQLLLNAMSSIKSLWKSLKNTSSGEEYRVAAKSSMALTPRSHKIKTTNGILEAVKVTKNALSAINRDQTIEESTDQTDALVQKIGPLLAPVLHDASVIESQSRMMETKIEMFGSLMSVFMDNIEVVDPDICHSVEKLAKAYQLLFDYGGIEKRKLRDLTRRYVESSDDEEEPPVKMANTMIRETLKTTSVTIDDSRPFEDERVQSICDLMKSRACNLKYVQDATIIGWLPKYDVNRMLKNDVLAALTVSIVGVAQGIAYSSLVGISPEFGCYSVIFPALAYSLIGSSKSIAIGPMSIPSLLLGSVADDFGKIHPNFTRIELVTAATFLTGLMLILLSILRVGSISKTLISRPVLKGFAAASGTLVMLGQLKHIFGISYAKATDIQSLLPKVLLALPNSMWATCLAAASAVILFKLLKVLQNKAKWIAKNDGQRPAMEPTKTQLTNLEGGTLSQCHESSVFTETIHAPQPSNNNRWLEASKCFAMLQPLVLLLIIGMLLGASLCRFEGFATTTLSSQVVPIAYGTGASLPAVAYTSAAKSFECHEGRSKIVAYKSSGSGIGIDSILKNEVDFAGTDVLIQNTSYAKFNVIEEDVLLLPSLATGICVTVNIPEISVVSARVPLFFKKQTLAKIFQGTIKYWDDVQILKENPNYLFLLPHKEIIRVARGDSSGTTAIFTKALSLFSSNYTRGIGKMVTWPKGTLFGQQNSGVIKIVESTSYAIGYAVVGDVKRHKTLQCAAFEDGLNGTPIVPTASTIQAAMDSAAKSGAKFDLISMPVLSTKGAWPISSYTYIAMRKNARPTSRKSCIERKIVVHFLMWLYTSPLSLVALEENAFVSLPYAERMDILRQVINMTCGDGTNIDSPIIDQIVDYSNSTMSHLSAQQSLFCGNEGGKSSHVCGTIKVTGPISPSFIQPKVPAVSLEVYVSLIINALLLSVIVMIEHLANAKLIAQKMKATVDENYELFSLGLANVVGGCFSCFVTGGGFSRTAINMEAGAKSQLSLLLSAVFAAILTFVIAPAIAYLPKFVIAVVIIDAVSGLIDVKEMRLLWKISKYDFLLLFLAAIFTMTLGIVNGLLASVALSVAIFVKVASLPVVSTLGRAPNTVDYRPLQHKNNYKVKRPDGILILRFEGPLFFANYSELEKNVSAHMVNRESATDDVIVLWDSLVLDFSCVTWIDSSAIFGLTSLVNAICAAGDIQLYVSNCHSKVYNMLKASECVDLIGKENIFYNVHAAVTHILRRREKQEIIVFSRDRKEV